MNELQIITIDGVDCYEQDGTAYLKLETVARGLGFTDNSKGVEYVRWNTVKRYLEEIGFSQEVAKDGFIPENVFYRLAMKAKNEAAEQFQAKIADEVIPSIRKHGGYIVGQEAMTEEELVAKALIVANKTLEERQKRIEALTAKVEADKPKVLFADAVSTAKTSILVGELAKLLKQNGVEIGQNRLFKWLRKNGYLIKRKGSDYNMPTQYSVERGWFEIKESKITVPDGSTVLTKTPKVTVAGQMYFINLFLGENGKRGLLPPGKTESGA